MFGQKIFIGFLIFDIFGKISAILHKINGAFDENEALHKEFDHRTMHDDIRSLVGNILFKIQSTSCIGLITDSIYQKEVYMHQFIQSIDGRMLLIMSIKDSEAFDEKPTKKMESMLVSMKARNCKFYMILVTNGIQMVNFLRYSDSKRLLNTEANFIMLHDYRLFVPDLHYIWKRIVNVIFIRKCDVKHSNWYELSTVPFPASINEVYVSRIVNYWTMNHYRWKKTLFNDKAHQSLNGVVLNVAILPHTPSVFRHLGSDNRTVKYSGVEIGLVNTLSKIMKFSINFYEPQDAETEKWGHRTEYGNFTGLLGEMDTARADIALGNLHYTIYHLDVMDLSLPYNTECLTFLTPESLTDNSWHTLILPFSLGMWTGVLVSLFCVGMVFFLFSNIYYFFTTKNKPSVQTKPVKPKSLIIRDLFDDLSTCILYTYSMLLVVSLPKLPVRWAVRVLTGWWLLYCVLVVVAYRASLTAILANPQPRVTIDTLEDLAESSLKCGAWGEESKSFFTLSPDQVSQKIGTKLEHVDDTDEAIRRVVEDNFAFFENRYTLHQLRFQHDQKHHETKQNLHIMEQCVINIPVSLGFDKNSPFKSRMDKYIRWAVEGGLVSKWLMDAMKTFESSVDAPPQEALMDLKKFYSALIALGVGYFMSSVVLIFEILHWKFVVERHPHYDKYYKRIVFPTILESTPAKITYLS